MSINTLFALLALGFVAVAIWVVRNGGTPPTLYSSRPCQGKDWRRAFPHASKDEIRQFLALFAESFAFADREKLKFNPNDQLLAIYRDLYPNKWQPDALEFNRLNQNLQVRYGTSFDRVWREGLTLGQLFASLKAV